MRGALDDAAPLYRDAPEAKEAKSRGGRTFQLFIEEVLPDMPEHLRSVTGTLIMTTLTSVGKDFSESPRSSSEIETFAEAMSDMFCAYIAGLQTREIGA